MIFSFDWPKTSTDQNEASETGSVRWKYHAPHPMLAGVTPTAGGLVFAAESPKTGNIKIRRIEFLNQNSLFGLDLEKFFFAPGLKIVLQHYRPFTSFSAVQRYVRLRGGAS